MLKKAGIVTAATAAGLLMASPLALAGESHHGYDHGKKGEHNEFNGIPVLNDDNVNIPIQACNDNVNVIAVQAIVGEQDAHCWQASAIFD